MGVHPRQGPASHSLMQHLLASPEEPVSQVPDPLENGFDSLPNLVDLGDPDPTPDIDDLLYSSYENLYLAVCQILSKENLLIPENISIFEITRFSLFDEETDLIFLNDISSDLFVFGQHSEYFQLFLDCLQHLIAV